MAAFNFAADFTEDLQWDFTFGSFVDDDALLGSRPASSFTMDDFDAYVAAEWGELQHSAPSSHLHQSPDTWARLRVFPELDYAEEGTSVCPSDIEGRSNGASSFGDIQVPESDDEDAPAQADGAQTEFEDDDDRPIQLLDQEADVAKSTNSKPSLATGGPLTPGTEGTTSSSLASTSVGKEHPAGGITLNNVSHGSDSSEGRDKTIKSGSAAKGKEVVRPRKASRQTSKATGVEPKKQFTKDSKGYAEPIEVLQYLHQAARGLDTSSFDESLFPEDQAVTVDEKGKYRCRIRGWIAAEGMVKWVNINTEPCGTKVATMDSYRRHVLETHLQVPRAHKHTQRDRLLKRIQEHYDAGSSGRKRKAEDDEEYEDGEQGARKRLRKRASSSE